MNKTIDLEKLKEPIKPKWKVQTTKGGKAVCVPYIDARDVQERFDSVCGPDKWQNTYDPDTGVSSIGIFINDDWIWKSDVGIESKFEAVKGRASDAIKRAAVVWGVGRDMYKIDPVVLGVSGKYAATAGGESLVTGAQLTNYIHGINTSAGLLMQIVKANPQLNDNEEYQKHVKGLLQIIKTEGK